MNLGKILCLLLFPGVVHAQTCCSGGVPMSSNIGFSTGEYKQLQYGFSYDNNRITRLYNETVILADNNRMRSTQSYILRAAYQWHRRFASELFIPIIRQARNIQTLNNGNDQEISLGLGDPAILVAYDVMNNLKLNWTIGLGIRLPLGSFSQTNDQGLLLINDMQPGSGAFDLILRSALSFPIPKHPESILFFNVIHTQRGQNTRYLGSQTYQFGRELQMITGYSRNVYALKQIWPLALGFRYRHAGPDQLNQSKLSNTGGDWLFARLSLGLSLDPKTQLQVGMESPFYSHVKGVQLSPDYIFNISLLGKIKFKKDEF